MGRWGRLSTLCGEADGAREYAMLPEPMKGDGLPGTFMGIQTMGYCPCSGIGEGLGECMAAQGAQGTPGPWGTAAALARWGKLPFLEEFDPPLNEAVRLF